MTDGSHWTLLTGPEMEARRSLVNDLERQERENYARRKALVGDTRPRADPTIGVMVRARASDEARPYARSGLLLEQFEYVDRETGEKVTGCAVLSFQGRRPFRRTIRGDVDVEPRDPALVRWRIASVFDHLAKRVVAGHVRQADVNLAAAAMRLMSGVLEGDG